MSEAKGFNKSRKVVDLGEHGSNFGGSARGTKVRKISKNSNSADKLGSKVVFPPTNSNIDPAIILTPSGPTRRVSQVRETRETQNANRKVVKQTGKKAHNRIQQKGVLGSQKIAQVQGSKVQESNQESNQKSSQESNQKSSQESNQKSSQESNQKSSQESNQKSNIEHLYTNIDVHKLFASWLRIQQAFVESFYFIQEEHTHKLLNWVDFADDNSSIPVFVRFFQQIHRALAHLSITDACNMPESLKYGMVLHKDVLQILLDNKDGSFFADANFFDANFFADDKKFDLNSFEPESYFHTLSDCYSNLYKDCFVNIFSGFNSGASFATLDGKSDSKSDSKSDGKSDGKLGHQYKLWADQTEQVIRQTGDMLGKFTSFNFFHNATGSSDSGGDLGSDSSSSSSSSSSSNFADGMSNFWRSFIEGTSATRDNQQKLVSELFKDFNLAGGSSVFSAASGAGSKKEFQGGFKGDSWAKLNDYYFSPDGVGYSELYRDCSADEDVLFEKVSVIHKLFSKTVLSKISGVTFLSEQEKRKLYFYLSQVLLFFSPSNFIFWDKNLLVHLLANNYEPLAQGMENFLLDLKQGYSILKPRQSSEQDFVLGENIAATKGAVIYQNDLMELIHYKPKQAFVYKEPVLIVPPWINKFYVLDLFGDKSFIGWLLDQGQDVFLISWKNPDAKLSDKGWDSYLLDGPLAAHSVISEVTGSQQCHGIGYCVGGTLLSMAMAYDSYHVKNDKSNNTKPKFVSGLLMAMQVDFEHAGELKVFIDEEQIKDIEQQMAIDGFLSGHDISAAFNLLRAQQLIWPYVKNNYILGKRPSSFDLLYWNDDSTRMTAANHSYYLRNLYLYNDLSKGRCKIEGVPIDLSLIDCPLYFVATKEDHIAPATSVLHGAKNFGSMIKERARFILGESGHIAGIVNSPSKNKYGYYSKSHDNNIPDGIDDILASKDGWSYTKGSWWLDYITWFKHHHSDKVRAPIDLGGKKFKYLSDAPGSYVRER